MSSIEAGRLGFDASDDNNKSVKIRPDSRKDSYPLMRDCDASCRLTAQHYLWKNLLGCLIHPNIPTRSDDLKIADVATGNGIWLCDVAQDQPMSAELHGFDINLDQAGPKDWLPANIHMHTWNIFEEPPQFVGYFDVVHIRLITLVIKNGDPRPMLANFRKLLKPDGYLQWDEVDIYIGSSIETVPGVAANSLDEISSQLLGNYTWKHHLKEIMNENGFTESMLYKYEYGLDRARFWNNDYLSAWRELEKNGLQTLQVSDGLEKEAMNETALGAAIMVPKLVWVSRKV